MSATAALVSQLKALKLGRILDTLDVRLAQARNDQLGYLEFLQLLLQDEIERRRTQSLRLRLQRASFEEPKTLEDFDFLANPALNPAAVRDLATGLFIERREHVLLYGPAGTGKTHLAQAIGHHACRCGRSVLFLKAVKLFRELHAARADNSWEAELRKLLAPDLLIIDDFGLKPMTMIQAEDFYEIVAERHLRGSIIVTSNRPPADWLPLFPDPVMANSALDRLAHNAHHFVMKGESYRKRMRPQSKQPALTPTGLSEGQTAQ
ncbi:MAG: IS21-like element helper ATPase IstB [Thermodesulfobacteriota bacterium]